MVQPPKSLMRTPALQAPNTGSQQVAAYADGITESIARRQSEPMSSSGMLRKGSIAAVSPATDSSRLDIASPTAAPIWPASSSPAILRQPAAAVIVIAANRNAREVMNAPS